MPASRRIDMRDAIRFVAMALIVVAAVALLAMCGEGVCSACIDAMWHGADRSGAARVLVALIAATVGGVWMTAVASFAAPVRAVALPAPPLQRVATLRI